jgi:hypothetical protein
VCSCLNALYIVCIQIQFHFVPVIGYLVGVLDYDYKGIMTEYLTNGDSTDNTQIGLFHSYVYLHVEKS